MRRILPALCLLFAGCTNAPVAGFLDSCFPSRAKQGGGAGVDVTPRPPVDPIRTGPPVPPVPIPPPDLGPGG